MEYTLTYLQYRPELAFQVSQVQIPTFGRRVGFIGRGAEEGEARPPRSPRADFTISRARHLTPEHTLYNNTFIWENETSRELFTRNISFVVSHGRLWF